MNTWQRSASPVKRLQTVWRQMSPGRNALHRYQPWTLAWRMCLASSRTWGRFTFSVYPGLLIADWRTRDERISEGLSRLSEKHDKRRGKVFYAYGAAAGLCAFCALPAGFIFWLLSQLIAQPQAVSNHSRASGIVALLVAAAASIILHEYGHARAARQHGLQPSSVGTILLLGAVPVGAYVKLENDDLAALPQYQRLSVVCAGVWHNAVLVVIASLVANAGWGTRTSPVFGLLGYQDLAEQGVVVHSVTSVRKVCSTIHTIKLTFGCCQSSPLADLVPIGSLILKLDDVDLHDSDRYGHWDSYLLPRQRSPEADLGWCVPADILATLDSQCCASPSAPAQFAAAPADGRRICFRPMKMDERSGFCIDPAKVTQYERCIDSCTDAGRNTFCVRPATKAHLLRLTIQSVEAALPEVIFYQGPREAVWRDIKIGRWKASHRGWQALPLLVERFWLCVFPSERQCDDTEQRTGT